MLRQFYSICSNIWKSDFKFVVIHLKILTILLRGRWGVEGLRTSDCMFSCLVRRSVHQLVQAVDRPESVLSNISPQQLVVEVQYVLHWCSYLGRRVLVQVKRSTIILLLTQSLNKVKRSQKYPILCVVKPVLEPSVQSLLQNPRNHEDPR